MTEIPFGEARSLTVVSPQEPDGTELVPRPTSNPAAKTFKKALVEQGIPLSAFEVDDIQREDERLTGLGVVFKQPPAKMGRVTLGDLR